MFALTLMLSVAALPACSVFAQPEVYRGNKVDADQLKELTPGVSTKADVTSLIGSPTVRATFDDNRWIYIGETTRSRIGRLPGVVSQDVTVLTFDPAGTLQQVNALDKSDAKDVDVVARSTPTPGSEASFLQQLLGNIGKFSTTPTGLGSSGPGPGSSGASGSSL